MVLRISLFLFFPLMAAIWITFSLQNGCKSLQIRILEGTLAPFWCSFCFLGTTFGPSSSLRALSGCLLEPNCAPKAFQDHSSNVFWSQNLQISSKFDSKIMRFPTDSNSSMPSNSPVLQASNHPIIQSPKLGRRTARSV